MASIELLKKNNTGMTISIIGTIQKVLSGTLDPQWKSATFDASPYKMGLGAASPESFESMGEGIIVNGQCYATLTGRSTSQAMKTAGKKTFYSMLMSAVPNETLPNYVSGEVKCEEEEMYDFIASLYKQASHSIAWRGLVKCSRINTMILTKSPIYGVPIFENRDEYMVNKVFEEPSWVYMVGAYTSDDLPNKSLVEELKERVFYVNPLDEKTEVYTHTHGLILKDRVAPSEKIPAELVTHAVHILNAGTFITDIMFLELYIIDRVNALQDRKK